VNRHPIRTILCLLALSGFVLGAGSCSGRSTPARELSPTTSESESDNNNLVLPGAPELLIQGLVRHMSTDELVGQMIMVSLEQDESGLPVTTLGNSGRELLRTVTPGGVILFGANINSVDQIQDLVISLQQLSPVPLIIATDHEGGNVSRLTSSGGVPATVMPSATLVGIAADVLFDRGEPARATELAWGWGHTVGSELRALGITMNLAPVADVDNPNRPGLLAGQRRTFGSDPARVAALVSATVSGMHSAGVAAVLKHFPGQGAAELDSHTTSVALDHTRHHLDTVELVPFVAGINAGVRAIMSAHISYPLITGSDEPATTSRQLITGLLREELGFDGVVITDALNMDAIALGRSDLDLAVSAIHAGADIMLKPIDPVALHAALVDATNSGMVSRDRLELSVRRILHVKLEAGLFGPGASWTDPAAGEILGSPAHRQLVEEIRAIARSGRE
jgi:beta-N-acetylhexosaminidase